MSTFDEILRDPTNAHRPFVTSHLSAFAAALQTITILGAYVIDKPETLQQEFPHNLAVVQDSSRAATVRPALPLHSNSTA